MSSLSPVVSFPFVSRHGGHVCRCEFYWHGIERYFVDDQLIYRQWPLLGKTAKFRSHGVDVMVSCRFDVSFKDSKFEAIVEVSLDDKLVVPNLLKDHNEEFRQMLRAKHGKPLSLRQWLLQASLWFVVSLSVFTAFKWISRHGG